jgi:hypothetical protein
MDPAFRRLSVLFVACIGALALVSLFAPLAALPAGLAAAVGVLVWGWFRPSGLEAGSEGIHVLWPWRRRWILRGQILEARLLDFADLAPVFRVGVGGLGGVFGRFKRSDGSWFEAYCTSRKGLLLLELEGGRNLLLSPADPEAVLKALGRGAE